MLNIRPATNKDHEAIWDIFHAVVAPGDTYSLDPQMSREDALAYWFGAATHNVDAASSRVRRKRQDAASTCRTYVAEQNRQVVGTYILKPNQPSAGAHVANAAFMVAAAARGFGVGRAMAEHCLSEARRFGFRAMQFNFVVSTNESALRLWRSLGFRIVGTLPEAFRHPGRGYVDVFVMFRSLEA
jgi:L-amino acid N-acyltransferase YncA